MASLIAQYVSLVMLLIAAGFAISLVRKTRFRASWILISCGIVVLVITQLLSLSTSYMADSEVESSIDVVVRWLNSLVGLVFLFGIFYVRKLIKYLKRVDEFRIKMENRILSAVIKTEERERQYFAKELHDGLGPLLSVVKMLSTGFSKEKSDEDNQLLAQSITQAVDEAIISVREISANISPHILNNFGLYEAIAAFTKRIQPTLNVEFEANFKKTRFPFAVESIMYRVVCELINNTIKHAGATKVEVKLNLEHNKLHLEYSDNGRGFLIDNETMGMGLENMRYRLRSGSGDLQIISSPGKGMRAIAYIDSSLF
ncbi:MAG: hypothetical protein J6K74_01410 [Marinifilaceae bacterium]|nr:hypothetical protein [Marinifilaceae bacterium]